MLLAVRCVLLTALLLAPAMSVAKGRVAFIVGNSSYENAPPLPNPTNDARLVARTLTDLGFEVSQHTNLSRWEIAGELSNFLKRTEGADLTLFYFAGHGMQFGGRNFLLGTDARLESELDIQAEALDLDQVTRLLRKNSRAALIFVDACRDNPVATDFYRRTLPATRSAGLRGLAELSQRFDGAMVTFSASPGQVAYDGAGAYSPFATALATHLPTPNIEILTLMKRVIGDVKKETGDRQVPMVSNDLSREIVLREVALRPQNSDPTVGLDQEKTVFDAAKELATLHGWAKYFEKYPKGAFRTRALEEEHTVLLREAAHLEAGFRIHKKFDGLTPETARKLEARFGLNTNEILGVQALLKSRGFYEGALDGLPGPGTRAALVAFQQAYDLPETGMITRATTAALGWNIQKLNDRPVFSSLRLKPIPRDHYETLGMDPRLFELPYANAFRVRVIYGYLNDRLYVATRDIWGYTKYNPRNIEEGAKIYPVSIGSAAENKFVYDLTRFDPQFWSADGADVPANDRKTYGPSIGLWQPEGSPEPNGGWTFVGDESSRFRRWDRGQPDNWRGFQNYAQLWLRGGDWDEAPELVDGPFWDDSVYFNDRVIIELE